MKKVFLGLGVVAATMATAQTYGTTNTYGNGTKFGVKAGMNVSAISKGGGLSDTKSKIGFNAGVFMNAPLSADFNIQPEVLYNDLGSKTTRTILGNNVDYSTNLGYISVPVMFQFNATPEFYLEAGPQFSFLVNANDKVSTNGSSATYELNKDNLNTFDFGAGLGIGYRITPQIGINARYVAGFTNIGKDNTVLSDSKNNNFQVGLSFGF